jgi:hypothetical protein
MGLGQGCGSVFMFLRIRIRIQRLMLEANTDPDPNPDLNPDPDPIRIQGFNNQKLKKNYSWKFFYIFFWSKTAIYLSLSLHKVCPSYRRSRIPNTDPDPQTQLNTDPIRIRIHNPGLGSRGQKGTGYRIRISNTDCKETVLREGAAVPVHKYARSIHKNYGLKQCCGSMTFWGGSGSSNPCLWLMDPDPISHPDPGSGSCYIRHWPSRCQQKTNFWTQFFLLITFLSYIYIIFRR